LTGGGRVAKIRILSINLSNRHKPCFLLPTIYQVNSTGFPSLPSIYQSVEICSDSGANFILIYSSNKKNTGMERGGHFTKKEMSKSFKGGLRRFLERGFDWIALVVITLVILLSLIFF